MSDINVDGIEFDTSHFEPGKFFKIEVSATPVDNGVQFTATSDGLLDKDTNINIKYRDSEDYQLSTTITILAGEDKGNVIVEDAKTDKSTFS